MWTITILLGAVAGFFLGGSILLELTKIRKALEYTAYRKEVHEIIETDYEGGSAVPASGAAEGMEQAPPQAKKIYRKTKIKVVEEN